MRRAINKAVKLFSETFTPDEPIVEIGSCYMPGYENLSDLRPYFKEQNFIGCDIRAGLGVDQIEDALDLSFEDQSVNTVLMFEILEHLPNPQRAIAESYRVLGDEGLLVISVPFTYRLHGFPSDYWRFTPSGVYQLLNDFPDKVVFALGPRLKPAFNFAVASKKTSPRFTKQKHLFKERVETSFQNSKLRGYLSELKERGRDFFGHALGRSDMTVNFYDGSLKGSYTEEQ